MGENEIEGKKGMRNKGRFEQEIHGKLISGNGTKHGARSRAVKGTTDSGRHLDSKREGGWEGGRGPWWPG